MRQTVDAAMDLEINTSCRPSPFGKRLHGLSASSLSCFFLYTKFILVLGKIFQITWRMHDEGKHNRAIQQFVTVQSFACICLNTV